MRRVVILGPGAAGKSALAARLGEMTGLPIVELDKVFWQPGLVAMSHDQWMEVQGTLVQKESWIMDGDLGPYDAVEIRLQATDTIIFLDFSIFRCACRALRRSGERMEFWRWLLLYRYRSRPFLMRAIAQHSPNARLYVLRKPKAVARFLDDVVRSL